MGVGYDPGESNRMSILYQQANPSFVNFKKVLKDITNSSFTYTPPLYQLKAEKEKG